MNVPDDLADAELPERIVECYPKHGLIDPTRLETGNVHADASPGEALINYPAE